MHYWNSENHPGWSIIPCESELFKSQNISCRLKVNDDIECIIQAILNYLDSCIQSPVALITEEIPIKSPFYNKDNIPDINDSYYKINGIN